jgi:hypothetical protein
VVVEFHARLHDQRDDARPGDRRARLAEGRAVRGDRRAGGFGPRDRKGFEVLRRAARRRHFGADDVHGRVAAGFAPGLLRDRGERGCLAATTASGSGSGSPAQAIEQSR